MVYPLFIQSIINGLLIGGIYSLVAVGLSLIFGVMNIVNFAHGAFMMLGMYLSYWLFSAFGLDPYFSLVFCFPLFFLFGAFIQQILIKPILNAPHSAQLLLTTGIMLFLENAALFLWSPDYRAVKVAYAGNSILLGQYIIVVPRLIAFLSAIIITLLLFAFLKTTYTGKAIRAISSEKEGAMYVGINVDRIYVIAFAIGTALVAVSGTLISPFFYVSPHVGNVFLITAFVVVVLGGMGDLLGALISGFIVGVAESLGALFLPGSLKQIVPYLIFVCILIFKPEGLFGRRQK